MVVWWLDVGRRLRRNRRNLGEKMIGLAPEISLAVLPEYRSREGISSVQLYRYMYTQAVRDGIKHIVSGNRHRGAQ